MEKPAILCACSGPSSCSGWFGASTAVWAWPSGIVFVLVDVKRPVDAADGLSGLMILDGRWRLGFFIGGAALSGPLRMRLAGPWWWLHAWCGSLLRSQVLPSCWWDADEGRRALALLLPKLGHRGRLTLSQSSSMRLNSDGNKFRH